MTVPKHPFQGVIILKKIILIFAIFITVAILAIWGHGIYKVKSLEKDTLIYLLDVQGYNETNILSIRGQRTKGYDGFIAGVTFRDESDVTYYYYRKNGSIKQDRTPSSLSKENYEYKHHESFRISK